MVVQVVLQLKRDKKKLNLCAQNINKKVTTAQLDLQFENEEMAAIFNGNLQLMAGGNHSLGVTTTSEGSSFAIQSKGKGKQKLLTRGQNQQSNKALVNRSFQPTLGN